LNSSNSWPTAGNTIASNQLTGGTNNLSPTARPARPARPGSPKGLRIVPDKKGGKAAMGSTFREGNAVDLVLEYFRPDTIYMKRPDAHDGPFLTIFTRDNIAPEITRRVVNHNLAVIVMGYIYNPDQEAALFSEWESLLGGCGFQRVVFLRGAKYKSIDGLPIVHESVIAGIRDDSNKGIAAVSKVPSAP
jgi:hypothetical protein